jgi:hypothetical protein
MARIPPCCLCSRGGSQQASPRSCPLLPCRFPPAAPRSPAAMPTGSQATITRLMANTLLVSWNDSTPAATPHTTRACLSRAGLRCTPCTGAWRRGNRWPHATPHATPTPPSCCCRWRMQVRLSAPAPGGFCCWLGRAAQAGSRAARRTWQASGVGHEAALKGHVGILHASQRDLVLDLGVVHAGGALAHDEAVDLHGFGGGGGHTHEQSGSEGGCWSQARSWSNSCLTGHAPGGHTHWSQARS